MYSERYQRQIILKGFGEEAQQRLTHAKVLVIGAGGLGCPALQYLVSAGVGCVGIIDDDIVSESNLHRQILYATADVGLLKVNVAKKKLNDLNPEVEIQIYPFKLDKDNILKLLKQYDFILDGTDNFDSRYLINDASFLLKKPLVFAAVSGFEGQLAVFNVIDEFNQVTNYRDLFPIPPSKGEIPNCSENGILGVLPGIIGAMQAAEVIKLITKIGKPLINKIINYNLLDQSFYEILITPSPVGSYQMPQNEEDFNRMNDDKIQSENLGEILEIEADELALLQEKESTIIIDVREIGEIPILNPSVFTQIPMSVFNTFLEQETIEDHIVLICQHGIRSVAAAEYLLEKYGNSKKIYSLKGGISRWKNHFQKL
ncbi:HesA/MoeB/ThiF family protein [Pedobacter mucosus]|uniref:HesA/MoeB/ThiF family protein n=1 Tax=Pedobacter mucosus TaxID=2895286 RepID=UPI001EE3CC8E|nr:HesA/MoeB/ThiF family protein [Pedobacter mucosus]UKT62263.1 HesA/MoeB/ThiF family protein [Pedobacter mucosus]